MPIEYMQITDEASWLKKRRAYVTSTEVACLYGCSPYMTAFELWHIKHGNLEPPDLSYDNFIKFGKLIEPVVVQMIQIEHPDWIIEPCTLFAYDDVDRIGSSFDYFLTIDGVKGLLEIKSTSYKQYASTYEEDEAPIHYEIQAQVELEMMPDAGFIMQVAFIADTRTLKYIRRERDAEMGAEMRKAVRQFWNMTDPPEPDFSRDKSLIAKLSPKADPDRTLDATQDSRITELTAMYKAEKELEKQSKENADKFYAELMTLIGNAKYIWTDKYKITVSYVKPSEGQIITQEMIGQKIGARDGYKRITVKEAK